VVVEVGGDVGCLFDSSTGRGRGIFPRLGMRFRLGFAFRGIPPTFFEECASCLECGGCEGAGNKCGEMVEIVGDAGWGCSKWGTYFI
jgi:hypothetical protein